MVSKRVVSGVVAGLLAVLAPLFSTAAYASSTAAGPACQGADVAVTALVMSGTVHGTLCMPAGGGAGTVMVLVPGATYDHSYWDFPYQPRTYNFRMAMNAAGYATFVVDRIGTGLSSRPLSTLVTSTGEAEAVHGVVQALRAGRIGGERFSRVVTGGHSLSSAIAIIEAGTYHDVDGVLLTGYAHHVNVLGVANLFLSFVPAALDPLLQGRGYDLGYLTTRVGTRAGDFYAPATTDPNVVATDEATKDVWSPVGEGPDGLGISIATPYTSLIHVPVLIVNGQSDGSLCGLLASDCSSRAAFLAQEAPNFSPAACLRTYLLPGSGHSVNLATDTGLYQKAVATWAGTSAAADGSCPG